MNDVLVMVLDMSKRLMTTNVGGKFGKIISNRAQSPAKLLTVCLGAMSNVSKSRCHGHGIDINGNSHCFANSSRLQQLLVPRLAMKAFQFAQGLSLLGLGFFWQLGLKRPTDTSKRCWQMQQTNSQMPTVIAAVLIAPGLFL